MLFVSGYNTFPSHSVIPLTTMKKEEIIDELQAKGDTIPGKRSVEFVNEYWKRIKDREQEHGDIQKYDLVDLPAVIKRANIPRADNTYYPNMVDPDNMEDLIHHSDLVYERIDPVVRDLRNDLFGQEQPKFLVFYDAIRWVEREEEDLDVHDEIEYQIQDLKKTIEESVKEYRERFGNVCCEFSDHGIEYVASTTDEQRTATIGETSKLRYLSKFQKEYSEKTGLTNASLFFYVTMGIKSVVPRWKLTVKRNEEGLDPQFDIETYLPNINTNDMQEIYKIMQNQRRSSKPLFIKRKDRVLLNILLEEGGVPDSGYEKFWENILEKCQEQGITDWTSSNTVKTRWMRLKDKLVDLEQLDIIDSLKKS